MTSAAPVTSTAVPMVPVTGHPLQVVDLSSLQVQPITFISAGNLNTVFPAAAAATTARKFLACIGFAAQVKPVRFESGGASALHAPSPVWF